MVRTIQPDADPDIFDLGEYQYSEAHEKLLADEGIPNYEGAYIQDIYDIETEPWERTGQHGAFINLIGAEGLSDIHVHDIEPDEETTQQVHLFDEVVYVAKGNGITVIGEPENEVMFEWSEGAVFSLPQQTPYKHINLANSPVRLLSNTSLPAQMWTTRDIELIFDPPVNVPDELNEEFYSMDSSSEHVTTQNSPMVYATENKLEWRTNFIPNIKSFEQLQTASDRGPERRRLLFHMSTTPMSFHITELAHTRYLTGHRHGPGAWVLLLSGSGYSHLWNEGLDEKLRIDWDEGTLFVPPMLWWHQHFATSEERARFFAFHGLEKFLRGLGVGEVTHPSAAHNHIPFHEEDSDVRVEFERELRENGMESTMPDQCYTDPEFEF